MQFLKAHPLWALGSLALAGLFTLIQPTWTMADALFVHWGEKRRTLWTLWSLFAVFYLSCYLTKPVFYTGYMGGTIGDNYMYVYKSLCDPSIMIPQHLLFPFVPGHLFQWLIHCNVFSKTSPHFLENTFLFFSLPNRLLALAGFWAFYNILRRQGCSALETFLGVMFLATSFGYWFWALQSNGMGILLPCMLLTLYVVQLTLDTERIVYWVLAAFLLALCFFSHISSVYFVLAIGAYLAMFGVVRILAKAQTNVQIGVIAYGVVALSMAGLFYRALRWLYGPRSLSDYGAILAGNWSLGVFSFRNFVSYFLRDGISTNIAEIFGLMQGGDKSGVETAIIIVQLAFLMVVLWRIVRSLMTDGLTPHEAPFVRALLVTFVACVAGFATRKTWFQYYVAIVPVSTLLMVVLSFSSKTRATRAGNSLVMAVLIACNMIINGLSSTRVTLDRQVGDQVVYRTLQTVKRLVGEKYTCFVAPSRTYPYNFYWLSHYYSHPDGAFKNIRWFTGLTFSENRENPSSEDKEYDPATAFHAVKWREEPMENAGKGIDSYDVVLADPHMASLLDERWPHKFHWTSIVTGSEDFPVLLRYERPIDQPAL